MAAKVVVLPEEEAPPRDAAPLSGFVLPPMPLPFTFRPLRPLTDDELSELAARNSGLDFEVDADGSVKVMTPSKANGSRLNRILVVALTVWTAQSSSGEVFGSDLGVRFEDGVFRAPDAAWLSLEKWREHTQQAGDGDRYLTVCPEFVAELRSPGDRTWEVEAKMEFWISRGAQLGWLIDPQRKLAKIYTPGNEPRTLLRPEVLEGEGPIAGFRMEMRAFWE